MVSLIAPCPPHEWSHAPTVGYFRCGECNERVEHSDPRYAEIMKEREVLLEKVPQVSNGVSPEMIEAGNEAYGNVSAFHDKPGHLSAVYLAMKALDPEVERVRGALTLARNRLQMAAINATAAGDKHQCEYSEWADEANVAISQAQGHGK